MTQITHTHNAEVLTLAEVLSYKLKKKNKAWLLGMNMNPD